MACTLCRTRKEKRVCPALSSRICTVCCGEQREVTLECPVGCVYLQQARQNEKPRSAEELREAELFRQVQIPAEFPYKFEPLIMGLLFSMARLAFSHSDWRDRDMIAALVQHTKGHERKTHSNLVFPESPNPIRDALVEAFQQMVVDYRMIEIKNTGTTKLTDTDIFHALVQIVRMAQTTTNGRPKSRRFVQGLLAQFPAAQNEADENKPTVVLS